MGRGKRGGGGNVREESTSAIDGNGDEGKTENDSK